ncbi:MAG: large-conductance mechanosensitive channel protein MscL [Patescibacteria group bacterium]|nr:large-conductance mechanosensitive channel protein MscL [Patescibacteria group bacterium]
MKLLREFKEFAIKGNVIDLATAVIIGGAFGKIVSSLVADIIMPIVGLLTGGTDFSAWKIILRPATAEKAALNLNAGIFIQNIIDFLIISASVFLMIKILLQIKNKFKKEEEKKEEAPVAPEPSAESKLLAEIRDILKSKE